MKNFDVVKPGLYKMRSGLEARVIRLAPDATKSDLRCIGAMGPSIPYAWCENGSAYENSKSSTDLVEYLGPLPGASVEPVCSAEGLVEPLADAAESAAADFVEAVLKARRELRERLCMEMLRNCEHMSADVLFDYADKVATRLEAIQ